MPASDEQELSFNALCAGVKFVEFRDVKDKLKRTPLHQQPCLHTYWTACYVSDIKSPLEHSVTAIVQTYLLVMVLSASYKVTQLKAILASVAGK